jgi:hypothetical protein
MESNSKIKQYVIALYHVFQMVHRKAEYQKNHRLKIISMCIYNYTKFLAEENDIVLQNIGQLEKVNLTPIFEYINERNIELYDFSTIKIEDLDVSSSKDLERFVLTHIYYLTQTR